MTLISFPNVKSCNHTKFTRDHLAFTVRVSPKRNSLYLKRQRSSNHLKVFTQMYETGYKNHKKYSK